jgi:bacillaene synthase trans-acting acyltransferase
MTESIVFMYSGQGSQHYGMGAELFAKEPIFRDWMEECDVLVRRQLGCSIVEELYESPDEKRPFDRLLHSHPALFAVEYSLSQLVLSWGFRPSLALGYSMGELVACTLAEFTALDDGLGLAMEQAQLVEDKSPEASMMAVLSRPGLLDELQSEFPACWPAAFNFDQHFVVSGALDQARELRKRLWERDVVTHLLPVRRGFHCELMDPLESRFRSLCGRRAWMGGKWPVISSTSMDAVERLDDEHWWRVARDPVRFQETIERLEKKGEGHLYVDLSPSGTLATFLKYLLPETSSAQVVSILGRSGRDLDRAKKARTVLEKWVEDPIEQRRITIR